MARVVLPNRFTPRAYQVPFMRYLDNHSYGGRAVWCVHRRGGKDLTAMHQTCKMAHRRRGTYWHVFPTAEQGRRSIWTEFTKSGDRIMEQVFPRAIRKSPREWSPNQEMVVELRCGSIWRLMGSDKIEVAGAGPVGVVFSEMALAKPSTWHFVRPMLREREGWAAFVSTPRGKNHFHQLWETAGREPGWWRELLSLEDTRAYDPVATIAEERAEGMPESLIRQEYLCDWTAANVGSVYGELVEALDKGGAIVEFGDYDRARSFTTWDLGGAGASGDATCFWLWSVRGDACDLVDYYEHHGKPLSHYLDEVELRERAHGLKCVRHWFPHDARAKSLVTGASVLEQVGGRWGPDRIGIYPEVSFLDGVQAARWLLQRSVRIHPRCGEGLEALKSYHYGWNDDRKVFSSTPVHDWSSHAADAFRGVACVVRFAERVTRPAEKATIPPVPAAKPATLDDLLALRPKGRGGRI